MLSELWENERHRLTDILSKRVIQEKKKVFYKEIMHGNFPEILKVYVKNQARKIFNEENPIRFHNQNRYNIPSKQINCQLQTLKEVLIEETLFTQQEIYRMAEIVVKFQFDALVRPRQTIIEMFFKTKDQRSKEDILVVLQGFGDDRPFIQELIASLERTNSEVIKHHELDELTNLLERKVYSEKPITTFLKEINLLQRFETSIIGKEQRRVSFQVLLGLLKERGLNRVADGLQEENGGKNFWSVMEVETTLQRLFLIDGLEHFNSMKFEEEPLGVEQTNSARFQLAEENPETETKLEPANSQYFPFQQLDKYGIEENLIINRRDIESQPPGPYPPLHTLISQKDRKIFIKKIFRKDNQQYLKFIERLENQDKWKEAKTIINEELEKRGISPYSKEAVLLGDVVFSRYFSKKI